MIKVGLTGGIGSGKTHIAGYFEALGIPVYNSDTRAKELMNTHEDLKKQLIQLFGNEIYKGDELNRKLMAERVFNDNKKLEKVNQLVHPVVQSDFTQWVNNQQNVPYLIKEAAILIESGAHKNVDKIIVVSAPLQLRINRVMQRDNVTKDQVLARMNKQMSQERKVEMADFIINNDGIQIVNQQVEKIHQQIIKLTT